MRVVYIASGGHLRAAWGGEIYDLRWLVEEYHKALKSGTRVTARQPKNAGRLEAMVA